jgi:signal transduction histidine kinase
MSGGTMEKHSDNQIMSELKSFTDKDKALRHLMITLEAVNDRLKESESLKTNFLSNIRNEINNPLTAIMGLSQQIMEGSVRDFNIILKNARIIFSEAFDLDFQLRNIFIAAEIEAGESSFCASNVDINALMQNTMTAFGHKANQKNISLIYSHKSLYISDENHIFMTDPEKLRLIVSNLLNNAIEFSTDKAKVELETKRNGKNLIFSIRDYGIGFHMDNEKIIFERFRQLDTGTRRTHRGHGLGLSITKDLTELFGGTISVESAEGRGSFFIVSIPELEPETQTDVCSDDGNVFIF